MYFVYILRCIDNSLYTGMPTDVEKRFEKHLLGIGAKYTRSHKPVSIELILNCQTKGEALKLERKIKSLTKSDKEKLLLKDKSLLDQLKINEGNIEKSNE